MAFHRFAIGQLVQIKDGMSASSVSSEIYEITGTLPPRGDSYQYRIRCESEKHERVTTEDMLAQVDNPKEDVVALFKSRPLDISAKSQNRGYLNVRKART